MSKQIEIKALLVYDVKNRRYNLETVFNAGMFEDGVYKDDYFFMILIEETTLVVDLPEGFDPVKPQLDYLDHKEKEVTFQYNQTIRQIQVERQSLLAIENVESGE